MNRACFNNIVKIVTLQKLSDEDLRSTTEKKKINCNKTTLQKLPVYPYRYLIKHTADHDQYDL